MGGTTSRRGVWRAVILCAGLALAGLGRAAPQSPTRHFGDLTLHACELPQAGSAASVAAWCGHLSVPENRAVSGGRTIDLNLAVLSSRDATPADDVVTLLAGGPGQAATASYWPESPGLRKLRKHRRILLVDQRGTGGSNALTCPAAGAGRPVASDPKTLARQTRACLAKAAKHADPRFYTTTAAVADLDAVRAALGVRRLDLVGVSYGTRVAQQYARAHPAHTRSLVLDGVVPNAIHLGQHMAVHLDDALAAGFAQCRAAPACHKRFGDPAATLARLGRRVSKQPMPVAYRDPYTSETKQRRLDGDTLAAVVRLFAYTPETAALLPLTLNQAAHDDAAPLMSQAALVVKDLNNSLSAGMGMSVICSEDAAGLSASPANDKTLLGNRLVTGLKTQCGIWPAGRMPANFHQPLTGDIPTLLISGARDPVTPPAYAKRVARRLANARSLVIAGAGHNNLMRGCMPRILADFMVHLTPSELDTDCLSRARALPAFVDANGGPP